ncbi:MAG: hypothetical protein WD069_09245 [Planctomycetales bacterium]
MVYDSKNKVTLAFGGQSGSYDQGQANNDVAINVQGSGEKKQTWVYRYRKG